MEPSSACACMSLLGYDPVTYYRGRAGIEALSMGIPVGPGEVVFRCNLVTVLDGKMTDYSSGHITSGEAHELVGALNKSLGSDHVQFYPGVAYRHILKLSEREDTLKADCTPPHDIPGQPVAGFLPKGLGSNFLLDLMKRSETVLENHPVNQNRHSRHELPATTIWLFWGTGSIPDMPSFKKVYGLEVAMTSGVDLLRGLARMMGMKVLELPGVTDGLDNDCAGQVNGALQALKQHDMVVVHVEAPDEAGHGGSIDEKTRAIEKIDREIVNRLLAYHEDGLRVLIMPDHPTPIKTRTHNADPVPFLFWGSGIKTNGALRLTESEGRKTDLKIDTGYTIMERFIQRGTG
jgi:2,3-bisphosphoglycerate-independent phosphoglycerate mutase